MPSTIMDLVNLCVMAIAAGGLLVIAIGAFKSMEDETQEEFEDKWYRDLE